MAHVWPLSGIQTWSTLGPQFTAVCGPSKSWSCGLELGQRKIAMCECSSLRSMTKNYKKRCIIHARPVVADGWIYACIWCHHFLSCKRSVNVWEFTPISPTWVHRSTVVPVSLLSLNWPVRQTNWILTANNNMFPNLNSEISTLKII